MRYGTAKSTGPWHMTFTLDEEPRCPGCAEFLQPIVVVVVENWAWCTRCVHMKLPQERHLRWILQGDMLAGHSLVAQGVHFYAPGPIDGSLRTLYEWYEHSDMSVPVTECASRPEGLYLLTRAGERAIQDIDMSGLEAVEDAHRRVRENRSALPPPAPVPPPPGLFDVNSDGNRE